MKLSLADAAEDLHLFLDCCLDSFAAGSEDLSGVEALANKVLAFFVEQGKENTPHLRE